MGFKPNQTVESLWTCHLFSSRSAGPSVYFLSRVKENMKLGSPAPQGFDRDDPINQGVLRDDFVTNSCGTMIRRVRFLIPETNEEIEFITNLAKVVPPGLVAQLYFMRWRIEKSFDELKNKLYESKAWAMSPNAKRMQAAFIILAYNLAQLLHEKIEGPGDQEKRPMDPPNAKKKEKRLQELKTKAEGHIKQLPLLREIYQKPSQLSAKFYRWLRAHLHNEAPWEVAQQRLITIYERF